MSHISITRALVELKTLDARINKHINNSTFIICKTKNKNFNVQEEAFRKNATGDLQSIFDLIERRNLIKTAIMHSNSKTLVNVANIMMTVSQAIEYKKVIDYKTHLLDTLRIQRNSVTLESECHKDKLQAKIDNNIQIICGKDKSDSAAILSIAESIKKNDPIEIFDPISIDKVIKELELSIEDFSANIDFVLSESNATNFIDV